MKRTTIIPSLLVLALFAASCGGSGQEAPAAVAPDQDGSAQAAAPSMKKGDQTAFVLYQGLGFWAEQDGKPVYIKSLDLTDRLTIHGKTADLTGSSGKALEYTAATDAKGDEGWIRLPYVGVGDRLGVIVAAETFIYTEPKKTKIGKQLLKAGALVVIDDSGSADGFLKIDSMLLPEEIPLDDVYVPSDTVSVDSGDIAAIQLLTLAKARRASGKEIDVKAADAFLSDAVMEASNPAIVAIVDEARGIVNVPTSSASGTMVSKADKVNVRRTPVVGSEVVGQLAAAQEVALAERTLEETVIDGVSAPWYRITAPFEGWVFGGFLE
ncbi:MAG: SH3 domain-containing protein [Spirochaetia bacterium]|nr:SH3 domain-containing protein [Spirochaetia bacterium]